MVAAAAGYSKHALHSPACYCLASLADPAGCGSQARLAHIPGMVQQNNGIAEEAMGD